MAQKNHNGDGSTAVQLLFKGKVPVVRTVKVPTQFAVLFQKQGVNADTFETFSPQDQFDALSITWISNPLMENSSDAQAIKAWLSQASNNGAYNDTLPDDFPRCDVGCSGIVYPSTGK